MNKLVNQHGANIFSSDTWSHFRTATS